MTSNIIDDNLDVSLEIGELSLKYVFLKALAKFLTIYGDEIFKDDREKCCYHFSYEFIYDKKNIIVDINDWKGDEIFHVYLSNKYKIEKKYHKDICKCVSKELNKKINDTPPTPYVVMDKYTGYTKIYIVKDKTKTPKLYILSQPFINFYTPSDVAVEGAWYEKDDEDEYDENNKDEDNDENKEEDDDENKDEDDKNIKDGENKKDL